MYFGTTLKYLDRESKYFEVVGPHGGPVISEGVQILQHYSEVIGPGGPNTSKYLDRRELFQGGPFFCDRATTVLQMRFSLALILHTEKVTGPEKNARLVYKLLFAKAYGEFEVAIHTAL